MRWFASVLLLLFIALQYRLWVGDGSYAHISRLKQDIVKQEEENERLAQRNDVLAREVTALKSGLDSVEEHAREDMGLIKPGETFFMVVEPNKER